MKKINVFIILIILASFGVGIYYYPLLPDRMASHWNEKGQVDGYMGKFWGLFLMPVISLILYLMFLFLPKIDPLKENIKKFRKYFDGFILALLLFLFYLYLLTIVWNLGWRFNLMRFLAPAFAILFYTCGVLVKNAKQNWFIGIRTPWTLMNEAVWDKTHELGGKLFKLAGVIALLGVIFPDLAVLLILAPVITFSFVLVFFSYFKYRNLKS